MSRIDRKIDRVSKKRLIIIILILSALVGWFGCLQFIYKSDLERIEKKIIESDKIPVQLKEELVHKYHFEI